MDSFINFHENNPPPKPQTMSNTILTRIPALGHLSYFSSTICIAVVAYLAYRSLQYLISELPPLGSGLKRLPGPISTLPYVGRVHDVDRMRAWNAMKKFSDEYDGLFACTLGGETHIWIAREDLAQDLLVNNSKISSARADLGSYPDVTQDFKYLPLLGFTDTFHRQRKFAHSVMTRCATNKYYGHINSETKRLMHDLVTTPSAWWHAMHLHCARVSSKLAYGCVDQAQDHVTNADKFLGQIGPSGPVANLLPFLASFPEWLVPGKRGVRKRQETEAKLWKNLFDKAKYGASSDRRLNTYTSASIAAKTSGEEKGMLFEKEEEAQCAVGMLCTVGVFTIAGPATLFVMAMILNPEWQTKVRTQIDEVVQDQMLDIGHSPRLPILRAAIKECLRWKSTVPLGVPRLLSDNYAFGGYHFPKGAVVHVLDIAMSQDPTRYENPEMYNPNRWLDEASPNFRAPLTEYPRLKGHHIFGRGKRACPGQDLAEAELFITCGNLLKFFTLGPHVNSKGDTVWPDPEKWTTDVIGGPLPFDCKIMIRDSSRLEVVRTMFQEEFGSIL